MMQASWLSPRTASVHRGDAGLKMSKIKKALERSRGLRAQNLGVTDIALSEREKLERDIRKLLQEEHPDLLGGMKKQIKLHYSKTQKIPSDPQVLLSNHVFALTHDLEITKQIEILRAQVLKRLKDLKANSLMITSANNGEGKTFISTNLAVSIAQHLDRTVMLVDADLRNRIYKHHNLASVFFNSYHRAGLSDYLTGKAEIEDLLVNPGIPRLTILPSGKSVPDSAALLGSPKMEQLIFDMKSRYFSDRILIFDCSSFLSNADPLILSRYVDAVLLIVENSKTEMKSLQRMIELLKDKKIIGTVINKSGDLSTSNGAFKNNWKVNPPRLQDFLHDLGLQKLQYNMLLPRFARRGLKKIQLPPKFRRLNP
jgi:protein-tyrosine kinase